MSNSVHDNGPLLNRNAAVLIVYQLGCKWFKVRSNFQLIVERVID
jgi:hypothetical protein